MQRSIRWICCGRLVQLFWSSSRTKNLSFISVFKSKYVLKRGKMTMSDRREQGASDPLFLNVPIVSRVWIRAARYEENMQYVITLLNAAILLAINKQILKCTQFCHSAAIMLLKDNTVLVEKNNERKSFPMFFCWINWTF